MTSTTPSDGRDRIHDVWGERTPHARGTDWPVRVDVHLDDGVAEGDVERWVRSACVLCSNGCGCEIAVKGGRMVGIRGVATDAVNHGRLGPKGLYGSTPWASDPGRLTTPLVRENGELREATWDEAMGRIVAKSKDVLERKGPLGIGFYTSGQLFLEEYYTLAVIGKAGLGTPHMDGNTRLCTATAGEAMKESFGCDGQPGSYTDIEHTDAIFLYGHNMPETQTVLWARILDRTRGDDPPVIVCVDPRTTDVAREALRTGGVHLAPKPGTNQALMNGMIRELLANGWHDQEWVDAHTVGLEELQKIVEPWTPEKTAEVCGIPAEDLKRAVEIFGTTERVLSTVLQGYYQSHQATAASCSVNNLHLLRGLIGKPGCGILQMNGQPTSQNTRETGADGDLPGFRNWNNPDHIQQLADLWGVSTNTIPHWAPPTHAMQIWRYAEQGSIELLWISATNPAVSLPDLARVRSILEGDSCMVVVQDAFLTETARMADVVLPAAGWGEKTGTYTNVNRTVHLSEKAVEPPGQAKADFDIFRMYAEAMDFRRDDGSPLIPWTTPEEAFEAWKECSKGRPCDYTGLTYDKLRGPTGLCWPVNDEHPDGTERLYTDGVFPTDTDYCETYGRDLLTGGAVTKEKHAAANPAGKAVLRAAPYTPALEAPDDEYPFRYVTGRTVYHFHTRTKTARARPLEDAAPGAWVELAASDAEALGVADGDLVRVESRRGVITAPARIERTRPREGVVFAPFHYGYWDEDEAGPSSERDSRAANELTRSWWDPASKQPMFKTGAVKVTKVGAR